MPFDSTTYQVQFDQPVGNTLAAIGVQPVPREIAEEHKAAVLEEFAHHGPNEAMWVRSGRAYWCTRPLIRDWALRYEWRDTEGLFGNIKPYEPNFSIIKSQLSRGAGGVVSTPDRSAAPARIVKVAAYVHRELREAKFEVEYFYDDPILNVTYTDAEGETHHDCLGIWDYGKVIRVADMPDVPSWHARLVRRLRGFFR